MAYKTRLKIVKDDDVKYFELMKLSSGISIGSFKSDYKVVDGNRLGGISQGIGLLNAGRSLSYTIPIFEYEDKKIYSLIAEYTSLISNAFSYDFFIEHFINDVWYSAKVLMTEINGYSVDITNNIKGFGFKCIMIDANFSGDLISEKVDITGSGLQNIEYESKSLVPTNIMFEWTIQGLDPSLSAWVLHNDNYGIVLNVYLGGGTFTLVYDGKSMLLKKQGEDDSLINFSGVQPFIDVGKNILTINNNYNTIDFIIKYRQGIAL